MSVSSAPIVSSGFSEALKAREKELNLRLINLIDVLQEEHEEVPEPPEEAPLLWTEAQVREYFQTGGSAIPPTEEGGVIVGQPGGGIIQSASSSHRTASSLPPNLHFTAEQYKKHALAAGCPDRIHGLFPPNDQILAALVQEGFQPFQKHLIDQGNEFQIAHGSWCTGDDACQGRGIDLRYFYKYDQNEGILACAVRFGEKTAIGQGFNTTAHGGSIESVLDEATAELAKIHVAPIASTVEASFKIKKPVPLNTSLRVDCKITEVKSNGLRIFVTGTINDGRRPAPMIYASADAQLVDVQQMAKFQPK